MRLHKSFWGILSGVLLGIPLLLYTALYFMQDSLIFRQRVIEKWEIQRIREILPKAEIYLETPDHIRLHGWYVASETHNPAPLIMYFGGYSEEVSHMLWDMEGLEDASLLLVNYRGYGLSEGKPSETNLFRDALFLYDEFSKRKEIDKSNIFAIGKSLGSGVAVYLASKRPLKAIILLAPYDSLKSVAQVRYPYAPVSLILKHPFDSISRAPAITIPLLALISSDDTVIPPDYSKRLVARWGGSASLEIVTGATHASIGVRRDAWERIRGFLHASMARH
jgi:uncharacterized protein